MKKFVYLLSCLLILAIVGLFVIKKPNGQAWLTANDILPKTSMIDQKLKSVADKVVAVYEDISILEKSQKEAPKIYRWKDSNGNWSYSDNPKSSANSEEVLLNPNDIVVLPSFETTSNNVSNTNANSLEKANPSVPNHQISTPSKVLNLYKDAKNVQKLMDNREKKISKAIDDTTD